MYQIIQVLTIWNLLKSPAPDLWEIRRWGSIYTNIEKKILNGNINREL